LLVPAHYVWMRWGFSVVAVVMMGMVVILRGLGQTIVF
jgi:heme exporter protein D